MKPCRLHWDVELGWVLDVPALLTPHQLKHIADWAVPRQVDRWRALPPGDKKEQLAAAIKQLEAGKVRQRVVNDDGTMFASTERTDPTTSYHFGG